MESVLKPVSLMLGPLMLRGTSIIDGISLQLLQCFSLKNFKVLSDGAPFRKTVQLCSLVSFHFQRAVFKMQFLHLTIRRVQWHVAVRSQKRSFSTGMTEIVDTCEAFRARLARSRGRTGWCAHGSRSYSRSSSTWPTTTAQQRPNGKLVLDMQQTAAAGSSRESTNQFAELKNPPELQQES